MIRLIITNLVVYKEGENISVEHYEVHCVQDFLCVSEQVLVVKLDMHRGTALYVADHFKREQPLHVQHGEDQAVRELSVVEFVYLDY